MHLDEEQIQHLLDGELPPATAAAAREHLAGCASCREELAAAEREAAGIHGLLQTLDEPLPAVKPSIVIARHRAAARWQKVAAGFVIALAVVGGAYAMPGSPLPRWVGALAERLSSVPHPAPTPVPESPQSPSAPPADAPVLGGIAVAPGSSLAILFLGPSGEGEIQVTLTDVREVQVRAPSGAATFTTGGDRLLVEHPASATYEIQIPRTAPRVEIQIDGRRIFLKEGDRVAAPAASRAGDAYLLPLIAGGS